MMEKLGRLIASTAIFAVLTPGAGAEPLGLGPTPGVLLLRNGRAIEGKISRVGEIYYVGLPNGEIRVRAGDVELCCRNLEEGYQRKRAAIHVGNVHDHLRLAQWCLRHKLFGRAGRELADALDADPRHPMIAVLERRLRMAIEPPKKRPLPAKPIAPAPSPEDLDRLVRGMPSGSVATFTDTIQPLLVNNCTAAGCHGPGSKTEFRLLRVPPGRPPSRRLTQRNLHAALQWIDREEPTASPLLTAPIRPHGTAKTAVFTDQKVDQYRRMVDWVFQVAAPARPRIPATVDPQRKPPVHATPAEPPGLGFPPPQKPALGRSTPKRGASLPRFVPVDPFDPEIFNRRFFPSDLPAKPSATGNSRGVQPLDVNRKRSSVVPSLSEG